MRFDAARQLKAELSQLVDLSGLVETAAEVARGARRSSSRGPILAEAVTAWRATAPRARVRMARRPALAGFAIGVAPRTSSDFGVAVRVYESVQAPTSTGKLADLIRTAERYPRDIELVRGVRYRPRGLTVRAGGSIGHPDITAGTLGAFVQDARNYYVLSNNHVLANSDNATVGDETQQPGPDDQDRGTHDVIAFLSRSIPLSRGTVDAAIARLNTAVVEFFEPRRYVGIGTLDPRPITDRYSVRKVAKRGRTTGTTKGTVSAFDLDGVTVDYESPAGLVTFSNQLEFVGSPQTTPFSSPGDSGSLIIDRATLRPYALLYAGGPDDQGIDRTLGHFLPEVLTALRVEMVP